MRLIGLTAAALLAAVTMANAQDYQGYQQLGSNYTGPIKVGNMCYKSNHHGTAFGYWENCKPEGSATSARAQGRIRR